jgi:pyruvate dehydrogenase E2 component (dihydrolipoamide acetyltransferase)
MIAFRMPSLGADMDEGVFVEWHVKPGDAVRRGDVVCVVETQKGAVDVEIWETGTIAELVAQPGQKLSVGEVLAYVSAEGAPLAAAEESSVPAAAPPAPVQEREAAAPGPEPATAAPAPEPSTGPSTTAAAAVGRAKVSPAARRRAQELGVDLADVAPGGDDGVISLADVEGFAALQAPRTAPAARPAAPPVRGEPAARVVAAPANRADAMRAAIAAAMSHSKREIPHYYLGTEINVENAAAWLEQQNGARPISERILFAALELKAVALALGAVPELNGHYVNGTFRPGAGVHLGVAVALREGGLVAPALHDADRLSLPELMARLKDLLRRARAGELRSSEMADPTITVTNLGDLGVETVFGVIQPPQVAIVGVGKVTLKPWVVDGRMVAARILHATLSADHRVTDGMRGARFLAELDRLFKEPEALA